MQAALLLLRYCVHQQARDFVSRYPLKQVKPYAKKMDDALGQAVLDIIRCDFSPTQQDTRDRVVRQNRLPLTTGGMGLTSMECIAGHTFLQSVQKSLSNAPGDMKDMIKAWATQDPDDPSYFFGGVLQTIKGIHAMVDDLDSCLKTAPGKPVLDSPAATCTEDQHRFIKQLTHHSVTPKSVKDLLPQADHAPSGNWLQTATKLTAILCSQLHWRSLPSGEEKTRFMSLTMECSGEIYNVIPKSKSQRLKCDNLRYIIAHRLKFLPSCVSNCTELRCVFMMMSSDAAQSRTNAMHC